MKTCQVCGKKLHQDMKYCVACGSAKIFDSDTMVSEYKRTCNQCGAVWHSLKTREENLKTDLVTNKNSGGSECCMCGQTKSTPSTPEIKANQAELERLKRCPNCQSGDFREELLVYDKK